MSRWICALVVCLVCVIGCNPSDALKPAGPSASNSEPVDPLQAEWDANKEATAWMMDVKHTLRGLTLEQGQSVVQKFLEAGVSELKVGDVQPDANDPNFQSAGKLIIKLPKNEKAREATMFQVRQLMASSPADEGQRFVEVTFGR